MEINSEIKAIDERLVSAEEKVQKLELLEKYKEMQDAWENSFSRIAITSLFTYFVALISMMIIGIENAVLNAFIPSVLYIISFQTIPFIKKFWIRWYLKNNQTKVD